MTGRRRRIVAATSLILLPFVAFPSAASADSPSKYGWWNEANLGLGVSPAPSSVPSRGLYVENGFAGPVAISALTFAVPPGAAVGSITLTVSGSATITSPPIACPLSPSSEGYTAAEGGPWTDRPAYNCQQAQVTGTVAKDGKSVSFDAAPLLQNGLVSAVILAGGSADQIAFDQPDSSALAVTPVYVAPASTGPPVTEVSPVAAGVPSSAPVSSATNTAGTVSPSSPTSPVVGGLGAQAPQGAVAAGASPPAIAPVSGQSSSAPARLPASTPISGHHGSSSAGRTAGEVLGLIGLLGILVAYTEGYGLLGGNTKRRRRAQPAVAGGVRVEA